jgi:hypothetical protein
VSLGFRSPHSALIRAVARILARPAAREVDFRVSIEFEAIEFADVLRLGDSHDASDEAVEAAEPLLRRDLGEVSRADGNV